MAGCDDGYATDLNSTGETRIVVAWAGALCSLAILVGLGLWGYELVMRDVSGVPVVRRMEGPMRVAPENPGGSQVVHQGLAVNQVTAEGAAAPPADRLRLAPRPVALADEDAPVTAASRPVLRNVDATQAVAEANESPPPAITAPALVDASFAQVPANDAPVAPGTTEQAQSEIAPETAEPPAAPAELTGLQKSLRPRPRPSGDLAAQVALASVTLSSAPLTSNEVAASAVLPGTNLVQLGAYDSPDVARQEWARLEARFESFLLGKQRVIQSAQGGGRTFYRLRAVGFADISDARRFCAALTAEGAGCIPVVAR